MQTDSKHDVFSKVSFLIGDAELAEALGSVPARRPFDELVVEFLNETSRIIMASKAGRAFSDVVTFGFWIRKASVLKLKERFLNDNGIVRMGKGVVFHVAPSNVPVNFAYSLAAGLLTGNANVVRIPSKDFPQVGILIDALTKALGSFPEMRPYLLLVRYRHDKDINDAFSSAADMRVVWGGDETIAELRRSPLPPRSGEITFADRYSLAFIDSDTYIASENKKRIAEDFYNDTFFTDQNACTSPRVVIWTGSQIKKAKAVFWEEEHRLVLSKYELQAVQAVNKLTSSCLAAVNVPGAKMEQMPDNLIVRIAVPELSSRLMELKDNSGYFYEYDCMDVMELKPICDDKRCQTIAYIGNADAFRPFLASGVKGIDRIVPMGKTMDFDLVWDGYELSALLTRSIITV